MRRKSRRLNNTDKLLSTLNNAINTLSTQQSGARQAGDNTQSENDTTNLSPDEKQQAAKLLKINHTGEVCAQALYLGQASQASTPELEEYLRISAKEEESHLSWCDKRLCELGGHTSALNPLFYWLSFSLGAIVAKTGDRNSLGFIHATETLVANHLREHLAALPPKDKASYKILNNMLEDEEGHAEKALEQGGEKFSKPKLKTMWLGSRIMTFLSARF